MSFFDNKNSFELANRALLYEPDFYASKIVHNQQSSVLDLSVPASATTNATSTSRPGSSSGKTR